MADDQLSTAEMQQLKEIAKSLPAGHPALNKVNLLLNSQPTEFEKQRPGGGTTEGAPLEHGGYEAPSVTKGLGSSIAEGVKGLGSGVLSLIDPTRGLSGAGLTAIGMNPREGTSSDRLQEIPAVRAAHEIRSAYHDPDASPAEVPLAGVGSLFGESAESAREHARRGESGSIIGEAAVPAAMTLAAYAVPKALPRIGAKASSVAESASEAKPLTRLLLGHRGAALLDLLRPGEEEAPPAPGPPPKPEPFAGATSSAKPIGSAKLPTIQPTEVKPLSRAPEEVYQRPIEAAPGAGKGEAPSEMHPDELAEIRKEAGKSEMTAEEAHRYRINKMASTAAATKPANDLGGMKRAGEEPEPAPKRLPTLFEKGTRPEPVNLDQLANDLAGVKPLKPDVPLREQLTPQPTSVGEQVDPIKVKYPDPAVRQMVRANGEGIYEAAKGNPNLVKSLHDLTRVELRQALINAGEDMGQTTVSNSKFAGEGSIPREEAFNRLLKRGLSPEKIVELAKKTGGEEAGFMPEKETPPSPTRTSNLPAQRAARDRAARIREARP